MANPGKDELIRKHYWIASDDDQWIKDTFGKNIGESAAIRKMISTYRRHVEARIRENERPIAPASASDIGFGHPDGAESDGVASGDGST